MYLSEAKRAEFSAYAKMRDSFVEKAVDNPAVINEFVLALRPWAPGPAAAGDVRAHANIPYKCVQAHDSTANPQWTPDTQPALWMQYHGTSKATARPWVMPTGAHDTYRAGEWMIWADGLAYPCLQDTVFSPADYPQAWGAGESIA